MFSVGTRSTTIGTARLGFLRGVRFDPFLGVRVDILARFPLILWVRVGADPSCWRHFWRHFRGKQPLQDLMIELVERVIMGGIEHMCIDVGGEGTAPMAELIPDEFDRFALGQQPGGVCVPEVMKSDDGDMGLLLETSEIPEDITRIQ